MIIFTMHFDSSAYKLYLLNFLLYTWSTWFK